MTNPNYENSMTFDKFDTDGNVSAINLHLKQQEENDIQEQQESEIATLFICGDLKEEFKTLDVGCGDYWTREDVLEECVDKLGGDDESFNLFADDTSDEVKLQMLKEIRNDVEKEIRKLCL